MVECSHCGSNASIRYGVRNNNQRRVCRVCKKEFVGERLIDNNSALIIGDTHLPYEHRDYLGFCKRIADKYNVGSVYHIGDLVDNHTISYHDRSASSSGINEELNMSRERLKDWVRVFPKVKVCIGNHDALPLRKIATAGLSSEVCKSYNDILGLPDTWEFKPSYTVGDVLISHGTGANGLYPFSGMSRGLMRSVVIGHCHSVAGIQYTSSSDKLIFGMSVGCGIDKDSFAFQYGENFMRKPIISCGVLVDGKPILEVMEM